MHIEDRNGDGLEPVPEREIEARRAIADTRRGLGADQAAADADQTASDADQTAADADQTAAAEDRALARRDQLASDQDQSSADRQHDARNDLTEAEELAYDLARDERESMTVWRFRTQVQRETTARDRDLTGSGRDRVAETRDAAGVARDERAADLTLASASSEPAAALLAQLEQVAAEAAADRARAAADRARAAIDRANAARERTRLEAELHLAHLDGLTGAYRREMGHLALTHEIDRARRLDGRFVLAFVDVDGLKDLNDRDGHAAGDRVLQTVVRSIRTRLRSFDPIIRYGGDEFVCGLGGTDLPEAERRFESIGIAIEADARVGISVGLAALTDGDDADLLTERADAAMLEVKAQHHSRG
jgi:diguanylate cyclase (GGDEF)-like protein